LALDEIYNDLMINKISGIFSKLHAFILYSSYITHELFININSTTILLVNITTTITKTYFPEQNQFMMKMMSCDSQGKNSCISRWNWNFLQSIILVQIHTQNTIQIKYLAILNNNDNELLSQ